VTIVRFTSPDTLYDVAGERFEVLAVESVRARGRLTVALSGGQTPLHLYRRLAASDRVPWESVHVFWSDERCVPPDHSASNYRAAREALLDTVPIPQDHVHRIEGESPPSDAAIAYEAEMQRTLGKDSRLDLVLLGMGADGHTASLFPEHPALSEDTRWVLPVEVSAEPSRRITLTLPAINAARDIFVLVVGSAKVDALARIEAGESLPAGHVRPTDGRLTWFVSVNEEA